MNSYKIINFKKISIKSNKNLKKKILFLNYENINIMDLYVFHYNGF